MARSLWIGIAVVGGGLLLYLLVSNGSASLTETGDEVSRALYLGLWGAVLAAGILGSGLRLSYVARSLALWLSSSWRWSPCYQYRYELQDVASRVSAGLIPGSPLSITERTARQRDAGKAGQRPFRAAASRSTGRRSRHGRHRRDHHGADRRGRAPGRLRPADLSFTVPVVDRQRHGARRPSGPTSWRRRHRAQAMPVHGRRRPVRSARACSA